MYRLGIISPRKKSLSNALRLVAGFQFLTKSFALFAAVGQVRVNFVLVFQVIANYPIDIGQSEHIILLNNFFSRGTVIEGCND